jgi:hypothetical protein
MEYSSEHKLGRRPRWRRRNVRMAQSLFDYNGRSSLFGDESGMHSSGAFSDDKILSDRLTLLSEPNEFHLENSANDEAMGSNGIISPRALAPNRESVLPTIPARKNFADLNAIHEGHLRNQSITNTSNSNEQGQVLQGDRLQHDGQSSLNSTTLLIIILVCYIIWQCFKGHNKQRKCLDDWPTLLTPSKRRLTRKGRQSGDECELQTIGQTSLTNSAAARDRTNRSAILRFKGDNQREPEVEIIQVDANSNNCDDTTRHTHDKTTTTTTGIKNSLMRNSLVVAVNRAAKPRVKLIGEKMKRFVDIEAQCDSQTKVTFAGRLVRALKTIGLSKSEDAEGQSEERARCEPNGSSPNDENKPIDTIDERAGQCPGSSTTDTVEVLVHRNVEDNSSSKSLLGFAGSFLEPTVNSITPNGVSEEASLQCRMTAANHQEQSSDSIVACDSEPNPQLSPTSPLDKSQLELQQNNLLGTCGCALARSKSQMSNDYCQTQAMNRLLTTSPANIRPCCSVSPSAMSRHEQVVAQLVHHHHQHHHQSQPHHYHPEPSLCGPIPPMGAQSPHCASYCGNNRAKHHYENYYDDEQEDAYRRLTASIGVQFGLAIDQQAPLLPATPTTCSMACKCNSSPPRHNIIMDGPIRSSGTAAGDVSLGDSDSGNFSLVNKQRVNSDSICNDSNCSLCQSSLLTAAPSQQTVFAPQPSGGLDQSGARIQGPPMSRWHGKRRSTLYSRQPPRRMSIAGVACQQSASNNGFGANPQHFMHRASIASDGINGFHHHHHHHHPASRQIYPPGYLCATKKSDYSSSAGSSSGIGFSGSQCLNTPTTGAFPYQSFTMAKPFGDQIGQMNKLLINESPPTWHAAITNDLPPNDYMNQISTSGSPSRKFSLPVQLESKSTGHTTTSNYKNEYLFNSNRVESTTKNSPTTHRMAHYHHVNQMDGNSGSNINSLSQKPTEQNRRSSQTIIRQSSFWLEDGNLESPTTSKHTTELDSFDLTKDLQLSKVKEDTIDPASNDQKVTRPDSSSDPPESPYDDHHSCGPKKHASTTKSARHKIQHSSSSSTSSPSPDFQRRQKQRLSSRTSQSSSITKRRFLGHMKQRLGHRQSGANSSHRRHGTQMPPTNAITNQKGDKNSTDDSLSSFDREISSAVNGRVIPDINSTSFERQCRDLWKLRATLHDDALVGDNWSNYHQRLNRRYDSGYKSIENQFSSSLEGPNVLSLSLHQASVTAENENNSHEQGRPQSGCSGMIQERVEEPSRNIVSTILNEEETQALLENCDDQQDDQ